MKARRIGLRDVSGALIATLDISNVDNADARAVMTIAVETMCDLDGWHVGQVVNLAPWGSRIDDSSA